MTFYKKLASVYTYLIVENIVKYLKVGKNKIGGSKMRTVEMRKILEQARRRGFFKRLSGAMSVVINRPPSTVGRGWFNPEKEMQPSEMRLDTLFKQNGAT